MIKVSNLTDAIKIFHLDNNCFDNEKYTLDRIKKDLNSDNRCTMQFEKNGEILGYVTAFYIFEEGNIEKICVENNYRKQGIGKELLCNIEKELINKGVNKIYLEVRKDNVNAVEFYKSNGYVVDGVRKSYYGDVDGLILWKRNLC